MPELTAGGRGGPTGRGHWLYKKQNLEMPELTARGKGRPTGRGYWLYKKCLNLQ